MRNWRMWARIAVGAIIAVVLFSILMNMLGDYRAAKADQKKTSHGAKRATGPTSTVTDTGRPPLTEQTSTDQAAPKTPVGQKTVVVVVDGVNLRTGPSTTGEIIRALKKNEKLVLLASNGEYYQVRDRSGTKGWVSAKRDYTRLVTQQ